MARVVLPQRIVPSYRVPVLRRIAEEFGWQIVFGRNRAGPECSASATCLFIRPSSLDRRAASWRNRCGWRG